MLTPFVRSDAVGAILAEVFTHPHEELSIAEVARRAGVLPAVAHKEISRLIEVAVLTDRRDGNNRLVRVNQRHPLYGPMAEIVTTAYGPVPVLRELLGGRDGIDQAFIYGSWAMRRAGQPGPFPHDIDVMTIGNLSVDDLLDIQAAARQRLSLDVNLHRTTTESWAARANNPFLAEVSSRPRVQLIGQADNDA